MSKSFLDEPKPATSIPKPATSIPKPATSVPKPATSVPKPATSEPKLIKQPATIEGVLSDRNGQAVKTIPASFTVDTNNRVYRTTVAMPKGFTLTHVRLNDKFVAFQYNTQTNEIISGF